jgi:hypothetical protein
MLQRNDEALVWAEQAYQLDRTHVLALRALAITAAMAGDRQRAHMAYQAFAPDGFEKQLVRFKRLLKREEDYQRIALAMQLASAPE